jgi:hypothetical protein
MEFLVDGKVQIKGNMKAEQLKQIIDKLVERKVNTEVKKMIRELVAEEVSKAMSRVLVEMVKEVKKAPISENFSGNTERQEYVGRENGHQPKGVKPIVTNNPKLDSVLAETARNYRPLQKTMDAVGSLADLMDGSFDKVGDDDINYEEHTERSAPIIRDDSKVGYLKQLVGESIKPQQKSVLDSPDVPDALRGIFKRDFRKVMRAVDEKKKNGMFSTSVGLG